MKKYYSPDFEFIKYSVYDEIMGVSDGDDSVSKDENDMDDDTLDDIVNP